MVSQNKKRQMMTAGSIGLVLGVFLFLIFFTFTGRWIYLFFVPLAGTIGLLQAYLASDAGQ